MLTSPLMFTLEPAAVLAEAPVISIPPADIVKLPFTLTVATPAPLEAEFITANIPPVIVKLVPMFKVPVFVLLNILKSLAGLPVLVNEKSLLIAVSKPAN